MKSWSELWARAWQRVLQVNPFAVFAALLLIGALGFSTLVGFNQTNDFCVKCHQRRGPYVPIDLKSIAHEPYVKNLRDEAPVKCLECHSDKELVNFFERVADAAGAGFEELTTLPRAAAPSEPELYQDADCLRCHYRVLEIDELKGERLFELSDKLAPIGLIFSHRRHFWVSAWIPELERRLVQINAGEIRVEQEELEFLERARLGHCAQCHERRRDDVAEPDKNVNLYTSNPMSCASCHRDALIAAHPGRPLRLPSEAACRRCHTGAPHGRLNVFLADEDSPDKQPCKKCHPAYRAEDVSVNAEDGR